MKEPKDKSVTPRKRKHEGTGGTVPPTKSPRVPRTSDASPKPDTNKTSQTAKSTPRKSLVKPTKTAKANSKKKLLKARKELDLLTSVPSEIVSPHLTTIEARPVTDGTDGEMKKEGGATSKAPRRTLQPRKYGNVTSQIDSGHKPSQKPPDSKPSQSTSQVLAVPKAITSSTQASASKYHRNNNVLCNIIGMCMHAYVCMSYIHCEY